MNTPLTEENRVENQPYDIDVIPEPTHPTGTTKVLNRVIVVAMILIAISLAIMLKWSLASTEVLTIKNSPFPARLVKDPTGDTGGIVFLRANYCKSSSLEGTIRVSYVSKSREIFLPVADEKLPKGCEDREVPIVIPKDIPSDVYKIKFRSTYDINPLKQNVVTDYESKQFEVTAQN